MKHALMFLSFIPWLSGGGRVCFGHSSHEYPAASVIVFGRTMGRTSETSRKRYPNSHNFVDIENDINKINNCGKSYWLQLPTACLSSMDRLVC